MKKASLIIIISVVIAIVLAICVTIPLLLTGSFQREDPEKIAKENSRALNGSHGKPQNAKNTSSELKLVLDDLMVIPRVKPDDHIVISPVEEAPVANLDIKTQDLIPQVKATLQTPETKPKSENQETLKYAENVEKHPFWSKNPVMKGNHWLDISSRQFLTRHRTNPKFKWTYNIIKSH